MTFLELQTEVLRRMGEPIPPSAAQVYDLLADVKAAINEGYECLSEITEWLETTSTLTLSTAIYYDLTDTATFTLSSGVSPLSISNVWSNQNNRWMRPTNWREMDEQMYPMWEASTGEPDYWFPRGAWWLGVFPHKPTASGTLSVHASAMPSPLSADGDVPGFPREFHQGLVSYALYDLFEQDREWKKADRYFAEYLQAETALKYWVETRMLARMHQFGGLNG